MAKLVEQFQPIKISLIILVAITAVVRSQQQTGALAHNAENVTRLVKVAPPATSSVSDVLDTIFRTSSAPMMTPGNTAAALALQKYANFNNPIVGVSNCSLMTVNNLTGGGEVMTSAAQALLKAELAFKADDTVVQEDGSPFGCHSCQVHEKIIELNLKSIQQHILSKLRFSSPPNMTNKHAIPQVPKQVVDEFLKQHHLKPGSINRKTLRFAKHHMDSDSARLHSDSSDASDDDADHDSYDDSEEMQGDDPDVEDYERELIEEEEDNYYPTVERMYVFPKSKWYCS